MVAVPGSARPATTVGDALVPDWEVYGFVRLRSASWGGGTSHPRFNNIGKLGGNLVVLD